MTNCHYEPSCTERSRSVEETKCVGIVLALTDNEFKDFYLVSLLNRNGIVYDVNGILEGTIHRKL
jgi:hypothetical protein